MFNRRVFAHRQIAADHHRSQRVIAFLARHANTRHPATAHYRCMMAKLADFIELMTDVEDGTAFRRKLAQGVKQLACRLRGKY